MPYQAEAMTQRMKRFKDIYLGLTVPTTKDPYHPDKYKCYRSGDRLMTLGYLRGFDKHADALTTRLRTSYAEAEELYEAKPQIYDDELLLGHLYLPEYTEEEQESTALYFFEVKDEALYPVEDEELLNTLLEIFTILNEDDGEDE